MTDRGRATVLFLVAGLLVTGGAFAVGQATGSDDQSTPEAEPLQPASEPSAQPRLAQVPAVPPLRAEPEPASGGGAPETAAPDVTTPEAEAPVAEVPAPEAPAAPQQPAPQPETPAVGE